MSSNDQISAIERLTKLRDSGALSEDEFQAQKASVLARNHNQISSQAPDGREPPIYRRLWVVVTLTALILTMPLALLVLATGKVFRKQDVAWAPISDRARGVWAGVLVLWLAAAFLRAVLVPGDIGIGGNSTQEATQQPQQAVSAGTPTTPVQPSVGSQQATTAPETAQTEARAAAVANGPPACTDESLRQQILDSIDSGFDLRSMPRRTEHYRAAIENLEEWEGEQALAMRRGVVANSKGTVAIEDIRICNAKDIGLAMVMRDGSQVGGILMGSDLGDPIPFGDRF